MNTASQNETRRPLTFFIIVAEESGDQLGSRLMAALTELAGEEVRFLGTGGSRMESAGLKPLLRPGEVDLIGVAGLITQFPRIIRRIREIAAAAIAANPDVVILVDSPEFSHRVARIVRRKLPHIPIINYVSPSVWAWRPGRAKRMVPYIDHVLALLPFEPTVYGRLGGPPCTYVGHPLLEKLPLLRPVPDERRPLVEVERPTLLLLPGSREAEVRRLMGIFGDVLKLISDQHGPVEAVLPAVPHLAEEIKKRAQSWPVQPTIVEGEDAKYAAFRSAHAALAASGTVSLELALSGIPTVVTYRIDLAVRPFKWTLRVPSVVLANVVMGRRVIPELLDARSNPESLANELLPLLRPGPARQRQITAFGALDQIMAFDEQSPSVRAAEMILQFTRSPRSVV
ncbi:MAG: lipid-A-disaccharide synthase [Alphaproteobacteria bacterium]